jgi:hypothetical protein
MQARIARFAPLAGVIFFILIVIAFVVGGDTPTAGDDSKQETVKFWLDKDGKELASTFIGAYAGLFFVWFAAGLRSAFDRTAVGRESVAARVSWGGALVLATGLFVALGLEFVVADVADDVSRDTLYTLAVLSDDFWIPFAAGFGLFLLGSGGAILTTGALPRWIGIVAIVLGIISVTPIGFLGFLGGIVWTLVASIALFRRSGAVAPAAAGTAPLGPPD